LALETLLDGQATALTQKAIDLALAGDMAAYQSGDRSSPVVSRYFERFGLTSVPMLVDR
jgi:hypothetical protein